uniref:Reverse transcriptase domain-containing protein n=1 Tax=Tanacetum cinerariifolium TaxID=118510 RepID=A0A6L2KS03_TANCI|nr:hypothetical protein [Tanacetum cinerariifolium]
MVIKSDSKEEMLANIKETLERPRVINLKLNPKKCSFEVEEGRFFGHLITKQGIKADPLKVKAISDLQPLKSVSEIQSLSKKLAAINRFLLKGADKRLPFIKGEKQVPMCFVSRTLHGAELEYPKLEKFILVLILARLEKSGRIAKWAIELGEHEIEFRGRKSNKGQILADFLAETRHKKEKEIKNGKAKRIEPKLEDVWKLFIDGASSSDGSGQD